MPAENSGTFRYWRDPVFLISVAVYALNRFCVKPHLHHYSPLFHGHLDDILTTPVALPIYLLVYRWIGLRPDDLPPRSWEIGLHVAVWIVFFEWFGPLILHVGVYDPMDDWSIAGGAVVAWALWQRGWLTQAARAKSTPAS
jgi:hypothetical protein